MESTESDRSLDRLGEEIYENMDAVTQSARENDVGLSAASKLESVRQRTRHFAALNSSIDRLANSKMSTTGSRSTATGQDQSNGSSETPTLTAPSSIPRIRTPRMNISELMSVNKALKAKNEMLEEENERYKRDMSNLGSQIHSVDDDEMTTDQRVTELADELTGVKREHEVAKQRLEAKTVEIEAMASQLQERTDRLGARDKDLQNAQAELAMRNEILNAKTLEVEAKDEELQRQAARLAHLELQSNDVHEKNLDLTRKIQELIQAAEDAERKEDIRRHGVGMDTGVVNDATDMTEERKGDEELRKELDKAQASLALKDRQLESVSKRASDASRKLKQYSESARGSGIVAFIRFLRSVITTVGWAGFVGFVYLLVSEDSLRPRGVDVFRFAH